jgi:CYTH domain-containing protein
MATEIERKFLLRSAVWRASAGPGTLLRQGYLSTVPERTVRVRRSDGRGWLTVKGLSVGATRLEFEYEVPAADADAMIDALCERPLVEKIRYCVEHQGLTWEIDEFQGENEGLLVAEVELEREDQPLPLPEWAGDEVTSDPRYANANLAVLPFRRWK